MAKIYLVNVGANTAHSAQARAPLFPNGEFLFVPFPDEGCSAAYERDAWPYVSDPKLLRTHPDPDWRNLTYGDNCHNRRAKALLSVQPGDILLFWALFWKVARGSGVFDVEHGERRWCLFGALTVSQVVKAERGHDIDLSAAIHDNAALKRALKNAHVWDGKLLRTTKKRHDVLFVGDPARSARFDKAVDLEVYRDGGLLQRTILSKDKRRLRWDESPRWNSSLRPCRPILDLSESTDRARAEQLRSAVIAINPEFDLLKVNPAPVHGR